MCARHRGAAPGPSGLTADHLRPLLELATALGHATLLVQNRGKAGAMPALSDVLTKVAQAQKPEAFVWRGDWSLPPPQAQQGLKVLGVLVGHPTFIAALMTSKVKEQAMLFERIPFIDDVQVGWLLLVFCAFRANQKTQKSIRWR